MQDDEETPRAAELPQRARRSESLSDLALRMTQAMATLKNPEPKGYNAFHKYNFVSIGQITDLVRKAMAASGIAMFPTVSKTMEQRIEASGKWSTRVLVELEILFVAAESGEWIERAWKGEASDTSDKAYNKAYTAALKQGLMKTFLIADEVDPDNESPEAQGPAKSSGKRSSGAKSSGSKASSSKPKNDEDAWTKANKRFWAMANAAVDSETAQTFHIALKALLRVESTKDANPQEIHAVLDKLDKAKDQAKAIGDLIEMWTHPDGSPKTPEEVQADKAARAAEEPELPVNEFDDDDIPF